MKHPFKHLSWSFPLGHASDKDKDLLPDYYLTTQGPQPSTTSTSSSEYSCISDSKDATSSDASSQVTRRSSVPSEGGADRRRVGIVEMGTGSESHGPSSTLRSRRKLAGLAIVAPPDASPTSYSSLTPPFTAPIRSPNDQPAPRDPNASHHNRSASEVIPSRKIPPRDIGIVGTTQPTSTAKEGTSKIPDMQSRVHSTTLHPPIFQQPKSASPSPSPSPDPTRSLAPIRGLDIMKREKSKEIPSTSLPSPDPAPTAPSPLLTPDTGEKKDIHAPVAPPIVLASDAALNDVVGGIRLVTRSRSEQPQAPVSATTTSTPPTLVLPPTEPTLSYVNYQPGVHSTAGPLPPPPRLPGFDAVSPPPPRPPRLNSPLPPRNAARSKDREALKQALQLPSSVSAALATQSPTKSKESLAQDPKASSYSMIPPASSFHRREGAFPPSSSASYVGSERDATEKRPVILVPERSDSGDVPQVTVVSEPPPPPSPILESAAEDEDEDLHPRTPRHCQEGSNENWVNISRVSSPSPRGGGIDREASRTPSEAPSPPPKSFRNSLTTGLKRLSSRSLPRTPTPSPSVYSAPLPTPTMHGVHGQAQAKPVRQKIVMQWPSAMFCNEIHAGRKRLNTSERCAIYAQKINELYAYDCGLTEWVLEMRFRGPSSNSNGNSTSKKFPDARSSASAPFTPQPRQTSRSSMISEATFPTRPDASTATDLLSSRDDDGFYHDDVPVLPYPSLATAQRAAASNVVMTPPASIRSLGSNSTIPSMNGTANTHPHTPASTLTSLSHAPTSVHHHTTPTTPLTKITTALSPTSTSSGGGGFFSTLGRKASLSSAKKPTLSALGLSNLISSPISTSSSSSSSGANIVTSPVVPGGPRAPPGSGNGGGMSSNRVQRSKTFIPTTRMERRPSLWELQATSVIGQTYDPHSDPEFVRQVDKLADLLPNADRKILAGYLRRAGQDVLAIGQYLEDEKNGALKAY
ncbi:hypothetical protein P691DRAFT_795402 [Macrolepiota fuliginosa MF-IS2]|uniref:Uncharacterized protein n=1 Tax=Macrolepiota fuliginosa MF-IS2 TaxID=1400762 RepID=A0A9P5XKN8_9AGAR|nr:hypothetical protein P691DRAFT_795402 [Macrolepiota fuliginosa MF-IS2]